MSRKHKFLKYLSLHGFVTFPRFKNNNAGMGTNFVFSLVQSAFHRDHNPSRSSCIFNEIFVGKTTIAKRWYLIHPLYIDGVTGFDLISNFPL